MMPSAASKRAGTRWSTGRAALASLLALRGLESGGFAALDDLELEIQEPSRKHPRVPALVWGGPAIGQPRNGAVQQRRLENQARRPPAETRGRIKRELVLAREVMKAEPAEIVPV